MSTVAAVGVVRGSISYLELAALYVVELAWVQVLSAVVYNPYRGQVSRWIKSFALRLGQAALGGLFGVIAWFVARAPAKDSGLPIDFAIDTPTLAWSALYLCVAGVVSMVAGYARGDVEASFMRSALKPAACAWLALVAMLPIGFGVLALAGTGDSTDEHRSALLLLAITLIATRGVIDLLVSRVVDGNEKEFASGLSGG